MQKREPRGQSTGNVDLAKGVNLAGPAPGFLKMPDYEVTVEREGRRIRALVMGECIADSCRTFLMRESNHSPVYYFPPADVRSELIEKSDYDSF